MIEQHARVILLVDVVASQDHHVLRAVATDDVEVLVYGVGRAAVPVLFIHALLGRQKVDEFVGFASQERPAALQVTQQRVRLVLGDDADAANARVDAV